MCFFSYQRPVSVHASILDSQRKCCIFTRRYLSICCLSKIGQVFAYLKYVRKMDKISTWLQAECFVRLEVRTREPTEAVLDEVGFGGGEAN